MSPDINLRFKCDVGGDKFPDDIGEQCVFAEHRKPDRRFIYDVDSTSHVILQKSLFFSTVKLERVYSKVRVSERALKSAPKSSDFPDIQGLAFYFDHNILRIAESES